jgi:hypothetical protein
MVSRSYVSWNGKEYSGSLLIANDYSAFADAVEQAMADDPQLVRLAREYRQQLTLGKTPYYVGLVLMGADMDWTAYYGIVAAGSALSVGGLFALQLPDKIIEYLND